MDAVNVMLRHTSLHQPLDRVIGIVFPVLVLGVLLIPLAPLVPSAWDVVVQPYRRGLLTTDMDMFYASLLAVREMAERAQQRVGVEITAEGWLMYQDAGSAWQRDTEDLVLDRGVWRSRLKWGTTFPQPGFFFAEDGRCYLDAATVCSNPEVEPFHSFSFTADANRLYTLSFDDGLPILEFDDF